jgi:ribokinase
VAGLPIEEALDKAALYAADAVTRRGAQKSFATEAEFEALRVGSSIG